MSTHWIYTTGGKVIGHTRKFIGIPSPMHARAIFTARECAVLGIDRDTMILAKPMQPDREPTGLTFDGEASFEQS